MKKKDEIDLWNKVKNMPKHKPIEWEKIAQCLGMDQKRLYYILEKWNEFGVLNYGISLRTSWIEEDLVIN